MDVALETATLLGRQGALFFVAFFTTNYFLNRYAWPSVAAKHPNSDIQRPKKDFSDVWIMRWETPASHEPLGVRCLMCPFLMDHGTWGSMQYEFRTFPGLLQHLTKHMMAGHAVPEYLFDPRLYAEMFPDMEETTR